MSPTSSAPEEEKEQGTPKQEQTVQRTTGAQREPGERQTRRQRSRDSALEKKKGKDRNQREREREKADETEDREGMDRGTPKRG